MSARPGGLHVLVIGNGGREHALAWAAAHSPLVERVSCAPGNAGTAQLGDNHDLAATEVAGLVELARAEHVDLVVVGPDAAVAAGVSDGLVLAGVPCFGPSQAAGRLEGSKTFAKELLAELGIATPGFVSFDRLPAALDHLRGRRGPVVVKADGLALGKGVFVCADPDEAATVAERLLQGGELGEAGSRILIEDCVHGQEASFFAICDGRQARMLPPARDYKRAEDGELGPNTGGMGSYAPAGSGWRELNRQVHDLVVLPVLEAMARRGHPYRGCLYVGAMVLEGQVQVLEFNARFGDPETEVLLPMIEDPLPILLQAAAGALDSPAPVLRAAAAVGVVAVREPYPGPVDPGGPVVGLAEAGAEGAVIFQMGTRSAPGGAVEVAGGRVLISTATGPDLAHAREAAYQGMKMIRFAGMRFRHDIAA